MSALAEQLPSPEIPLTVEHRRGAFASSLHVSSPELGEKNIPILSIRNPYHHKEIAHAIAGGAPVAFEVGVIGVLLAVNDPYTPLPDNWRTFWEIKRGRKTEDKVPMYMPPEHQWKIVDYDKLHPEFQKLRKLSEREKLYGNLPLHVIMPFKESAKDVNTNVFVTYPEDAKSKPQDMQVPVPTVCIFFQEDRDWRKVSEHAMKLNPFAYYGVTSFNDHGEPSPWTLQDLVPYTQKKGIIPPYDLVVEDHIFRSADIKSSHTQVRLPLLHEEPTIKIIRRGPVTPEMIEAQTGFRTEILPSAKFAASGHPEGTDLSQNVYSYINEANAFISLRDRKHAA